MPVTANPLDVVSSKPHRDDKATAVAGFLAGYWGSTRVSCATDVSNFSSWCQEDGVGLFTLRRSHLELFGRWMEENGRMRSTGGPAAVHPGELLPLLPTRRAHRAKPSLQRA